MGVLALEPWDRFERARATEAAIAQGSTDGSAELAPSPGERRSLGGRVPFFDLSSTAAKGRFRVHDARGFDPESMRRVAVPPSSSGSGGGDSGDGVSGVQVLLGRRRPDYGDKRAAGREQAITVMFDRGGVGSGDGGAGFATEAAAEAWWHRNKAWLLGPDPL